MRFSVCKDGGVKTRVKMDVYKEEILKKEIEKAMKEGHICGEALKKVKRFRSAFTTEQINYLENEFRIYPYVGNARRKDVATVLNIPERAVKIWFQNRRMKEKKDTSNKEPDTGKTIVINNALNMRADQSTSGNDDSLSLLTSQVRPIITSVEEKKFTGAKFESATLKSSSFSSDVNCKPETVTEPKFYRNSSMIMNLTTAPDFVPKYKIENKGDGTKIRAAESTVEDQMRQDSPDDNVQYKTEPHNFDYFQYLPSSSVPEDLSSKTNETSLPLQPAPVVKLNNELPVYLKGFYAQPYLPPSNVIWRPVDVAPIVPAPVGMVPCPGSKQPMMKRNCSCDCHKPYSTPMLLQNSSGSNIQYVVTAIPFQNPGPKS